MNTPLFCVDFATLPSLSRRAVSGCFLLLIAAVAALVPLAAFAQLYTDTSQLHGYASSEAFGIDVAADGDTLVVATPTGPLHEDRRAYVFVRGTSGWTLQQPLAFPTSAVAIDGDTLVGGGVIYVRSGSTWTQQQAIATIERPIPALQGDTLVLGAPLDRVQDNGAVYVFTRSGSTWTQQAVFGADTAHEQVGSSVALDGETLIAGIGNGTGGAYVYVRNGTTWSRQTRLVIPTGAGWGMKVALEGNVAAVSDPANNTVYVFTRAGRAWTLAQTLALPPGGGNNFGYKLALDGGILAVGADTAFHLYSRTASGWVLAQTISAPAYRSEGGMALANQGKLLVTGNPSDNSSTGVVDIYSVPPPPAPGTGWQDVDIGAVGVAGHSAASGADATVYGSGSDIWGPNDQFHFRTETMTGDGAIIAHVTSAGSGNPWAKVGLMAREDIAPAARAVMALVTPGGHLGTQVRSNTSDTTSFQDAGWATAPIWLMLARSGNVFGAYRSDDGDEWTLIGAAMVAMPETIHVGLAVSSHDNATLNSGTFLDIDVVGLDAPQPPAGELTGSNLGAVAVIGSHSDEGGTLTIDAAGSDIWETADSGYFVHRAITGDFDLRARVASMTATNPWAKAGVMVRESLAAGGRNLFTLVTAGNAAGLQVRSTAGAATAWTSGPWTQAPLWVRLVRTGNNFAAFVSPDGTTWQAVGTATVDLPATLEAGVAVSSHEANATTHVTVTNLDFGD